MNENVKKSLEKSKNVLKTFKIKKCPSHHQIVYSKQHWRIMDVSIRGWVTGVCVCGASVVVEGSSDGGRVAKAVLTFKMKNCQSHHQIAYSKQLWRIALLEHSKV